MYWTDRQILLRLERENFDKEQIKIVAELNGITYTAMLEHLKSIGVDPEILPKQRNQPANFANNKKKANENKIKKIEKDKEATEQNMPIRNKKITSQENTEENNDVLDAEPEIKTVIIPQAVLVATMERTTHLKNKIEEYKNLIIIMEQEVKDLEEFKEWSKSLQLSESP